MNGLQIRSVQTREDLKSWVTFPRRHLYPADVPWVAPLDRDLYRILNPSRNPFYIHGESEALMVVDQRGRTIGRILAHVYRRHMVRHSERAAFFGYFECRDDLNAARLLVDAARAFGRRHGCSVLRGPFNLTAMQEMGVLLEGFEFAPAIDETYTPRHYPSLLDAAGLRPTFPHSSFRVDDLNAIDADALLNDEQRAWMANDKLCIRTANPNDYAREFHLLRDLLNDSFYENPHFVPITEAEFAFQIDPYKRLMDPEISLVAEIAGVPCGFVVTVPDYNLVLRDMHGRCGPWQIAQFLHGRSKIRDACVIIMGVQRQLQGKGLMRIMHAELVRALQRRGYRSLTVTWIADVNARSIATMHHLGAHPLHRLTLYEGPVSINGHGDG